MTKMTGVTRMIRVTRKSRMSRMTRMTGVTRMSGLTFRAEKRSAQASAHPLSQAQGGLFCVLTVSFDCVCLLLEF